MTFFLNVAIIYSETRQTFEQFVVLFSIYYIYSTLSWLQQENIYNFKILPRMSLIFFFVKLEWKIVCLCLTIIKSLQYKQLYISSFSMQKTIFKEQSVFICMFNVCFDPFFMQIRYSIIKVIIKSHKARSMSYNGFFYIKSCFNSLPCVVADNL